VHEFSGNVPIPDDVLAVDWNHCRETNDSKLPHILTVDFPKL
jgi:hypothetical protein